MEIVEIRTQINDIKYEMKAVKNVQNTRLEEKLFNAVSKEQF